MWKTSVTEGWNTRTVTSTFLYLLLEARRACCLPRPAVHSCRSSSNKSSVFTCHSRSFLQFCSAPEWGRYMKVACWNVLPTQRNKPLHFYTGPGLQSHNVHMWKLRCRILWTMNWRNMIERWSNYYSWQRKSCRSGSQGKKSLMRCSKTIFIYPLDSETQYNLFHGFYNQVQSQAKL